MWRWVKSCLLVVGHVAVVVEEGLERSDQLGAVLLVVGDQRRDGLRVEALQLGRVLAHRGQQQPVGAGLLERELARSPRASATFAARSASAPARCRSAGSVAWRLRADRDHEAGQVRLELVQHGGRRSAPHGRSPPGTRITSSRSASRPAPSWAARAVARPARLRQRGQRAALDGACAALGQRQDARAPVALLAALRTCPHHDGARAVAQVAAQLGGRGPRCSRGQ